MPAALAQRIHVLVQNLDNVAARGRCRWRQNA